MARGESRGSRQWPPSVKIKTVARPFILQAPGPAGRKGGIFRTSRPRAASESAAETSKAASG